MTREGYDKKKAELERLESVEMIEVTKRVAAARALGDLAENAEYHAAREDQGMLQAKINSLRSELARAYFIDTNNLPKDEVVFGSTVLVEDLEHGGEETFHLVGPGQEDYENNRILVNSPIGQGLVGKKVGEIAEIQAPMGLLRFQIKSISFDSAG